MATGRARDDDSDSNERDPRPVHVRVGDRLLGAAEQVVYAGIAVLLLVLSVALLVDAAGDVAGLFGDDAESVALELLDTLLLVFIVVELLSAVRTTIVKRELVAEPFLLAGIIASIKEIIVLSVKAAEVAGKGDVFRDQMIEIGVLGVLVLALGVTALLLRKKEREPEESGDGGDDSDDGGSRAGAGTASTTD